MKRSIIIKIAAVACVLALLGGAGLILGRSLNIGLSYADAAQYTAGGTSITETVNNLDVNWTEGSVTIAYHAKDTVEIAETAPKAISEDTALRWWLDGDTLRIQYAKPGFFSLHSLNKALTVTLPEGRTLENVSVDATSADVKTTDLLAKKVTMNLTSGDLALSQKGASDSVALESTSGNVDAVLEAAAAVSASSTSGAIRIAQSGAADSVALDSTSGDLIAELKGAKAVTASSTSGAITVTADAADDADLGSTSGSITVRLAAFGKLKIGSTSGNVTAALPTQPGFTARVSTTSGSFGSAIALKRDGDRYACGDESASVEIDTTSGDVRLEEVKAK